MERRNLDKKKLEVPVLIARIGKNLSPQDICLKVVWVEYFFSVKSVSERNNRLEKKICKPETAKCGLKLRRILKSLSHIPPKTETPWHYGENSKAFSQNSHKSMQKTDRHWEVCLRATGTLAYVCQSPNISPQLQPISKASKRRERTPTHPQINNK